SPKSVVIHIHPPSLAGRGLRGGWVLPARSGNGPNMLLYVLANCEFYLCDIGRFTLGVFAPLRKAIIS
ncbi:hypothetical protein M1N00_03130, partial [Thermodesulfovibrionales bacterium]|nr:hypothetical protein [Thermodesulfovibrionales bacterium]